MKADSTQPISENVFLAFVSELKTGDPLFQQLYGFLKQGILAGRFQPGAKLPPSRTLAKLLEVSRNTVLSALDQMIAEGYLETRPGSGIFIARNLPDQYFSVKASKKSKKRRIKKPMVAKYGERVLVPERPTGTGNQAFRVGMPALPEFPHKQWQRLLQKHSGATALEAMGYGDMQGYRPLREAIANYVRSSRGVICEAEQVIITNGAQQSLDLSCRILLDKDDTAAIEEPGYIGARKSIRGSGASILLCQVTEQGFNLESLKSHDAFIKLLYCTPAHQYPMGMTLPLAQRLELLNWMGESGGYILEDDYDSEYYYQSRPIPSLQGLDEYGQVIYMGSFSKVLFPSLRLGYLVVPSNLVKYFVAAKAATTGEISPVHERVVAEFMAEGYFATHLKRMRTLYQHRLELLLALCERDLSPWCELHANGAGMHVVLSFKSKINEKEIVQQLFVRDINCSSLSSYYTGRIRKNGLVLGFANANDYEIERSVAGIYEVLMGT